MGLFDYLNKLNNQFFDGLKQNAIDKALSKSSNTNKEIVSKGSSTDLLQRMKELKEQGIAKDLAEAKQIIELEQLNSGIINLNVSKKDIENDAILYGLSPEEQKEFKKEKEANKKKLDINLSYEEVVQILGYVSKKEVSVSRGKKITKLYFYEYKNRIGNIAYEFEVTLKEGKVYGWKDLSTISTGKGI